MTSADREPRHEPTSRHLVGDRIHGTVKRLLDVSGAALALALTCPVLAVAALAIVLEDGRPIMFLQERVGRRGRVFRIAKLRTMRANQLDPAAPEEIGAGHALVLRSGALLRRLKIDELPQLWNVLVGEMSLVGPRPAVPGHAARYDAFQSRRVEVRPGLSGWAQVNGNTELSWDERILLDVWYVDHRSLWLDLTILLRTARVVLSGERRGSSALRRAIQHANRLGWSR